MTTTIQNLLRKKSQSLRDLLEQPVEECFRHALKFHPFTSGHIQTPQAHTSETPILFHASYHQKLTSVTNQLWADQSQRHFDFHLIPGSLIYIKSQYSSCCSETHTVQIAVYEGRPCDQRNPAGKAARQIPGVASRVINLSQATG